MGIGIRKLGANNIDSFKELIHLFEDVFEMKNFEMPGTDHLQKLLENKGFFVFVALSQDKVIGGLTAYTLQQYYSAQPLVYIYDLAVKQEFQRQGIGKMLIDAVAGYCSEIGAEEMFVQANEEDAHAIEFYQSTGATPQKVVHFNYRLKAE